MTLQNDEKERIRALAESRLEPADGMEIHFVTVVNEKASACSPKEKEWLAYWRSIEGESSITKDKASLSETATLNTSDKKTQIKLTLYNPVDINNWAADCKNILKQNNMLIFKKGLNCLQAWKEKDLRRIKRLYYCDALEMGTVWLRAGRVGIRLYSKRLYFENNDTSHPIERKKESDILGGITRPDTPQKDLLTQLVDIGNILIRGNALAPCVLPSKDSDTSILKSMHAIGKKDRKFELTFDLWKGLRSAEAYYVPEQFNIIIVHDYNHPANVVQTYISNLIKDWLPEIGVHDADRRVHRVSLDNAFSQMSKAEKVTPYRSLEESVFLVAISGKPGDPLPTLQKKFLELLDRLRQQYRVFSYDNQAPKWSARAQVGSILQGAGGIPYRLILPIPEEVGDCLIYGVDIGHDHTNRRISRVVVSVSDRYGSHLISVWTKQKLNEAAADKVLRNMLIKSRLLATEKFGITSTASIVLRDGRIPSKRRGSGAESLDTYLGALGADTSVVECRKRGNPIMYAEENNSHIVPARGGSTCIPDDSAVQFICTHDSQKGLPNILKIHIPKGADGLDIGLNNMSKIITGLCYSPSLGLRPHLPGPIYWADGIGSTSTESYKFAGQNTFEFSL